MRTITEKTFRIIENDVSHERLDGEVIAVNMKTGHYYSLSGSAADMWSLVASGVPAKMWASILGMTFGKTIPENDFDEFIAACIEAGLIGETENTLNNGTELPADYVRTNWIKPRLEEFDDMRDLILVDPIHDITQLGWPHTK